MKVGRNDPCPCGSGKKYKKCCLEKDKQVELAAHQEPETEKWEPEEEPVYREWDDEQDEPENDGFDEDSEEEDSDDEEDFEQGLNKALGITDESAELPKISDEENKLVDDWWDEYKKLKDTVKEREHLVAFIDQYPHLVDYLGLYYEVLFELGGDHFKSGIYEIFVELLLRIREEFPFTYKKSFEYYDSDLIYWYTAQGRLDEIDTFFDNFKEAGEYNEKIDDLMSFFHAINRPDILLRLLDGTKYTEHISFIIVCDIIMQRYIDQPVTDELIQSLSDELAAKGIVDGEYKKEYLKIRLLDYARPLTPWDNKLPKKRSQAIEYYSKICSNFAYFLYKNTELSLSDATMFSYNIDRYYQRIVNSGDKRTADIFCLDRKTIFKYSLKYYDTMFWGCDMECFVELNAFYYYILYLKTCGNISEEQKDELLKMITDLYQEAYDVSKDAGPEMLSFKQFPLF